MKFLINKHSNIRNDILFPMILSSKLKSIFLDVNSVILDIESSNLKIVSFLLKNFSFFKYTSLINLFCLDSSNFNRYFLMYNLMSIKTNSRVFIRNLVPRNMIVDSLIDFFPSSNWLEREVWDFFGIFFYNHGDLRRILTDYGFEGFPLKKNFPLTGFYEVLYDAEIKSVVYTFLETSQEIRFYQFSSPWDHSYF